jgi:hypothetical protein
MLVVWKTLAVHSFHDLNTTWNHKENAGGVEDACCALFPRPEQHVQPKRMLVVWKTLAAHSFHDLNTTCSFHDLNNTCNQRECWWCGRSLPRTLSTT